MSTKSFVDTSILKRSAAIKVPRPDAYDTTVASELGMRVVNAHLMGKQTSTMMLGGVLFLAGVIVLVTARPTNSGRDSKDGEQAEAVRYAQRQAEVEAKTVASMLWLSRMSSYVRQLFIEIEAPLAHRLRTGALVGLSTALAALLTADIVRIGMEHFAPIGMSNLVAIGLLPFAAVLLYSLRRGNALLIRMQLHQLNVAVWALAGAIFILWVAGNLKYDGAELLRRTGFLVWPFIPALLSALALIRLARAKNAA